MWRPIFFTLLGTFAVAETIKLPITRDTWVSAVGKEADCNLGGATKLKTKSIQEMTLFDVDVSKLKGRSIQSATLHFRVQGKERQERVTVSSLAADFVEGSSPRYAPQAGSSTFNHRAHPKTPWAFPGSDLTTVMLGEGGTIWSSAQATPPDAKGWQSVDVDPRVIGARVAEVSGGFVLFDDTGSEWTLNGDTWTQRLFPNRFIHSRDSGPQNAPYMTVELGPADQERPAAPTDFAFDTTSLPAGEVLLRWKSPADAVGFMAKINGNPVPRYLFPQPGETCEMHVRDLKLDPAKEHLFWMIAMDAAGNPSNPLIRNIPVSSTKAKAPFPERPAKARGGLSSRTPHGGG